MASGAKHHDAEEKRGDLIPNDQTTRGTQLMIIETKKKNKKKKKTSRPSGIREQTRNYGGQTSEET